MFLKAISFCMQGYFTFILSNICLFPWIFTFIMNRRWNNKQYPLVFRVMLLLWTRDVIKTKSFCIEGYVIFLGRRCYYKQYPFVSREYVTFIIDGLVAEFKAITWFSVLEFRTVIVVTIIFSVC